jgi:hypothetical protein
MSSSYGQTMLFIIIRFLKLIRRDIADRLKQALGIEPVNSLERCFLKGFPISPWAAAQDYIGLI